MCDQRVEQQASDPIVKKLKQQARGTRRNRLAEIDEALAWGSVYNVRDDDLTIVDPESGTSLTFRQVLNGAFGRE